MKVAADISGVASTGALGRPSMGVSGCDLLLYNSKA